MEKNREDLTVKKETAEKAEVTTKGILKDSFKGFYKSHKKISKLIIALVVFVAVFAVLSCVLRIGSVQTAIFNSFIPEKLTDERTGIVFYREGDPKYGPDDSIQSTMKVYYYLNNDPTKEKVYLEDGIFHSSDGGVSYVSAGFVLSVLLSVQKMITAFGWIAVALAVLAVVLLIVAWYRSFQKQELARKASYRKSHPRH